MLHLFAVGAYPVCECPRNTRAFGGALLAEAADRGLFKSARASDDE